MARPKRHHFVTRAYLEGFLEAGQTQLYCWGRFRPTPFQATPENLAVEGNYYSLKKRDGTWDDRAETLIADSVESPGLLVLKKLASGRTRLNWQERSQLALLIAFQEFRVPFFRSAIARTNRELLAAILEEFDSGGSGDRRTVTLETR